MWQGDGSGCRICEGEDEKAIENELWGGSEDCFVSRVDGERIEWKQQWEGGC